MVRDPIFCCNLHRHIIKPTITQPQATILLSTRDFRSHTRQALGCLAEEIAPRLIRQVHIKAKDYLRS